jgi:hypothetical protein
MLSIKGSMDLRQLRIILSISVLFERNTHSIKASELIGY